MYMCMCIYIYIYIYTYTHIPICVHISGLQGPRCAGRPGPAQGQGRRRLNILYRERNNMIYGQ